MSAGAAFAGVQMASALYGGLEERKALRAGARVDRENALQTILEGEQQIAATRREERQVSGAALAALASGAASVGTGTAADIIRQNGLEREIEILNVRARAQGQARGHFQAAADKRAAGRGAMVGAVFKAVGAGLDFAAGQRTQGRLDAQAAREWNSRAPASSAPGASAASDIIMLWRPGSRLGAVGLPGY